MKNIVTKIIKGGWICVTSVCYLACETSLLGTLTCEKLDSCFVDRFIQDTNGLKELGFSDTSNVLWYTGKMYVNWFWPVKNSGQYRCFFDVCQGKDPTFDPSAIMRDDRNAIVKYIVFLQSYLSALFNFYPPNGNWQQRANNMPAEIGMSTSPKIKISSWDDLRLYAQQGNISNVREKLGSCIWGCMHTEPICVFDCMDRGGNITFVGPSDHPVQMCSRFKPCSNWECSPMLSKVAETIKRDIKVRYLYAPKT
ncbi:MAG: hypothetical protein LBR92_03515 [Puniceicoccales bacterium]|jgi:hypothetical protein|nr:hypothetical protein [Puniceicoccales bacterium]